MCNKYQRTKIYIWSRSESRTTAIYQSFPSDGGFMMNLFWGLKLRFPVFTFPLEFAFLPNFRFHLQAMRPHTPPKHTVLKDVPLWNVSACFVFRKKFIHKCNVKCVYCVFFILRCVLSSVHLIAKMVPLSGTRWWVKSRCGKSWSCHLGNSKLSCYMSLLAS